MSNVVRAWKDAAYRESLSAQEQAMLPENPAGGFELTDAELEAISGAWGEEEGGVKVVNISAPGNDSDDIGCASVGIGANCGGPIV